MNRSRKGERVRVRGYDQNGTESTHKTIREAMARKATDVCERVKETVRRPMHMDIAKTLL